MGCGGSQSDESLEAARRLGGLSAPSFTGDEIKSGVNDIASTANTLVMSDGVHFLEIADLPPSFRFETQCAGDRCVQEKPISGETSETTVDELVVSDGALDTLRPRPVGERHGVRIARIRASDRTETGDALTLEGYAGWMEHGAFLVTGGEIQGGDFGGARLMLSSSFGDSPNTVPDVEASWNGVVAGIDTGATETQGNAVLGQARIDLEMVHGAPVVDVAFTELFDLETRESRSSLYWDDGAVTSDGFSDGGSIDGRFYGADHQEAGGVFERGDLLGAFGAAKEE